MEVSTTGGFISKVGSAVGRADELAPVDSLAPCSFLFPRKTAAGEFLGGVLCDGLTEKRLHLQVSLTFCSSEHYQECLITLACFAELW